MIQKYFYTVTVNILRLFFKPITLYSITGRENLKALEGAILAVNHTSFTDPIFAAIAVYRPIRFLARKTLFNNILFGTLIRALGAIPFNRDVPDIKSMTSVIKILKSGDKVLIFPEGTRSPNGKLQKGLAGVGFIALKSAVPAVPIFIEGAYKVLPRWRNYIVPAKVRIKIGKPVYPDKWLTYKKLEKKHYQQYVDTIMERLSKLEKE